MISTHYQEIMDCPNAVFGLRYNVHSTHLWCFKLDRSRVNK